jgi:hypothetical protein
MTTHEVEVLRRALIAFVQDVDVDEGRRQRWRRAIRDPPAFAGRIATDAVTAALAAALFDRLTRTVL